VKAIVPDPDICTVLAVPQLYTTNAALEASYVIEESETFNNHSSTSTQFFLAGRAFLLAGHAKDPVLGLPAARRPGRDFGPAYTHSTTAVIILQSVGSWIHVCVDIFVEKLLLL